MKRALLICISVVSASGVLANDSQTLNVQALARSCTSCHASAGTSGALPSLDGLTVQEIEARLKGFRSGSLPSTLMQRIAKGYSDDEIKALAKHFGSQ